MNRLSALALTCLLFFCGAAHSVELVDRQAGDVLLFPFFTTEKGWDTYINVSTFRYAQSEAPVLRVRVLDGVDGDLVRSFNVYPAANENWRISISQRTAGSSVLRVAEGSCLVNEGLGYGGVGAQVGLSTRVGMVEIYVLGVYEPDEIDVAGNQSSTCEAIAARWGSGGVWDGNPQADILNPPDNERRLIQGELYQVNVSEGLAATYEPLTLRNVFSDLVHTSPGNPSPDLTEADSVAIIDGQEVRPNSGQGIDALALAIGGREDQLIVNDVITSNDINARTDWVVSYPLAPYKNHKPFNGNINGQEKNCEGFGDFEPGPLEPTVGIPSDSSVAGVITWGGGDTNYAESDFQPPPTDPVVAAFCQAVNVVAFGNGAPVLVADDSPLLTPQPDPSIPDPADGGSLTLGWLPYPQVFPNNSGIRRPVFGFRMTTFQNGTLNGGSTLANYAVLRRHQRQ